MDDIEKNKNQTQSNNTQRNTRKHNTEQSRAERSRRKNIDILYSTIQLLTWVRY